jgi:hypothetical protein
MRRIPAQQQEARRYQFNQILPHFLSLSHLSNWNPSFSSISFCHPFPQTTGQMSLIFGRSMPATNY